MKEEKEDDESEGLWEELGREVKEESTLRGGDIWAASWK